MSKIAFLDIDGTLIAGQAQQGLIRLFREHKRLSFLGSCQLTAMFVLYKLGLYSNVQRILNMGLRCLEGMPVADATELVDRYVQETIRKDIFPKAFDLVRDLHEDGFKVVLLSSSIDLIVSKIKSLVSADDYICTELDISDGLYTGHARYGLIYGPEKAERMKAYAVARGVALSDTVAYADHETDIEMLKIAGKGFIANPNRRMQSLAQRNGLGIIDLRS